DDLTMLADYYVPQILSHKRILIYSSKLKEDLKHEELIPFRDEDEIKIRSDIYLSCSLSC
ncbi:unnamed protein product, partial [Rotaria sp. Silwood1]